MCSKHYIQNTSLHQFGALRMKLLATRVTVTIRHLPRNLKGRDFIVGDLHGMFNLLMDQLTALEFNVEVDRLISVGDLMNRGPHSFEILQLLEMPWFHAALGNHEGMLLTWARIRPEAFCSVGDFLENGGSWVFNLSSAETKYLQTRILPLIDKLPLVLKVDSKTMPFYALHAERSAPYTNKLMTDSELESVRPHHEGRLTWSRRMRPVVEEVCKYPERKIGPLAVSSTPWEAEVSLTYVGHSIMPCPVLHRSQLYLDCGAFLELHGTGYMCIVEHDALAPNLPAML